MCVCVLSTVRDKIMLDINNFSENFWLMVTHVVLNAVP